MMTRPELDALVEHSRTEFNALPAEEQEAVLRAQRESWARFEVRPYRAYPDDALLAEHRKWDERVANATSWGGALAAAAEARDECAAELRRRGIDP